MLGTLPLQTPCNVVILKLNVVVGKHQFEHLVDLGSISGVSAIFTGKLLFAAGLRTADGEPTTVKAMTAGLV